jgi:photosystem II stability/assembly factor-like uncharacterized protein
MGPRMLSAKHYGLVALIVAAVAFVWLVGGATGRAAPDRPARVVALVRSERIVDGGQRLLEAWPVSSSSVWAWTETLSGHGAQGLQLTIDGGKSWIDVTPSGLGEQVGDHVITGFFALDAEHAWVVYGGIASGAAQSIAATSDGGRRWTVVGRRPSSYGCTLQFVSPDDGWCTLIGAALGSETVKLYRTEDGGTRWQVVLSTSPANNVAGSLPFGCDKDVQFVGPSVGWAMFACEAGVSPLYETLDGGATWIRRRVAAPAGGVGGGGSGFSGAPVLADADGAVGYTIDAPKERSVVYVSRDSGVSWRAVTPPGGAQPWLVDIITPLQWRLVAGERILATDDGGRSWYTITADVDFAPYSLYASTLAPVDFTSAAIGWIVNQSSPTAPTLLWRTTDGGHTWRRISVPGT